MLIINFEGREAKGLSKGRYDETFDGEDGQFHAAHVNFILIMLFLALQKVSKY